MGILDGHIPLTQLRCQDDSLPTDTSIAQVFENKFTYTLTFILPPHFFSKTKKFLSLFDKLKNYVCHTLYRNEQKNQY